MSDLEKIVKGCKKYQADSQKELYKMYFGVMMTICLRYTANKHDAEEMLNNGFLKIFTNINQYEGKGSFEGWMKKTMSNTCLDFFKTKVYKESRAIVDIPSIENQNIVFDHLSLVNGNFSTNEIDEKYEKEDLLKLLNDLPPLTNTIFNLIVFEEYTHKEIAKELDIAERTSQWHFSNAKKTLAELLMQTKHSKKTLGL